MPDSSLQDLETLEPWFEEFKFQGKQYVLREAGAEAARLWRAAVFRCTKPGVDGKVTITEGLADTDSLLVSHCLFEKNGDGKETPVKLADVRLRFPARVLERLFALVQKESGLEEKPPEEFQLLKALKRDDAPVTLERFREWVNGLPSNDFRQLRESVAPDAEERIKNSLAAMAGSSA